MQAPHMPQPKLLFTLPAIKTISESSMINSIETPLTDPHDADENSPVSGEDNPWDSARKRNI
jgi:hypothetical protein